MSDCLAALQPRRAFRALALQPFRPGVWLALRRPLLVAFVLACGVTMMAAEPFDPRLLASSMLGWACVPLCESLGLLAVIWHLRRHLALSRAIDLYFTGHAPWLLWFTALSFDWSLQSPHGAPNFMFSHFVILVPGTLFVIAWSGYVDYCCLNVALKRSPLRALRDLAVQRLISWVLIVFVFGWGSPWVGILDRALPK